MITRDIVQGFIDGYVTAGGDPSGLQDAVNQYLVNHPAYPQSQADADYVSSSVKSYRVTPQATLAPTPVPLVSQGVQQQSAQPTNG